MASNWQVDGPMLTFDPKSPIFADTTEAYFSACRADAHHIDALQAARDAYRRTKHGDPNEVVAIHLMIRFAAKLCANAGCGDALKAGGTRS